MKKFLRTACATALLIAIASPAHAHITVQPNEAAVGVFSRFVIRVPTERPDASTVKIKIELPPLAFVSFEPKDGWKRIESTRTLEEPIEAFGEEITEVVGSVTWSGGEIGVGEFDEFGFSARTPDDETTLEFRAIQTYSSGEVVRWTGAPDSEAPAPLLSTYDIGASEEEGQLAVLARLNDEVAALTAREDEGGSDLLPIGLSA